MDSVEPKAERLARLGMDIGYALGRGELPEDMIREFRWLWRITPDQEKDGLGLQLKDIEEMVRVMRAERHKLKVLPVVHKPVSDPWDC